MEFQKIKRNGFIFFGIVITLLALIAILWIWDVLDSDTAWKSATSLAVLGFSTLMVIVVWDKLYNKN